MDNTREDLHPEQLADSPTVSAEQPTLPRDAALETIHEKTIALQRTFKRLEDAIRITLRDVSVSAEPLPENQNSEQIREKLTEVTAGRERLETNYAAALADSNRLDAELVQFAFESVQDFERLTELSSQALTKIRELKNIEAEGRQAVATESELGERLEQALLSEGGFPSQEAVTDAYLETRLKKTTLEGRWFANRRFGKEIGEHTKKIQALESIRAAAPYTRPTPHWSRPNREVMWAGDVAVGHIATKVVEYHTFAEGLAAPVPEAIPELESKTVDALNDSYIDATIRPELFSEEARRHTRLSGRIYAEQAEQGLALLKRGFDLERGDRDTEPPGGESYYAEWRKIAPKIYDTLQRFLPRERANDTFEDFARLASRAGNLEWNSTFMEGLDRLAEAVRPIADHSHVAHTFQEKGYKIAGSPSGSLGTLHNALESFDVERWKVFTESPSVQEKYGAQAVAVLDDCIRARLAETLLRAKDSDENFEQANRLLLLTDEKAAPYLLMSAFYVPGHGGYPLIEHGKPSQETTLYAYLAQLSSEQKREIGRQGPPGSTDVLETIEQHKTTFSERILPDAVDHDDPFASTPNPAHQKVLEHLGTMRQWYLTNGTPDEQKYAVYTMSTCHDSPPQTSYEAALSLVQQKNSDRDMYERVLRMLRDRVSLRGDISAMEPLLEISSDSEDCMKVVQELLCGSASEAIPPEGLKTKLEPFLAKRTKDGNLKEHYLCGMVARRFMLPCAPDVDRVALYFLQFHDLYTWDMNVVQHLSDTLTSDRKTLSPASADIICRSLIGEEFTMESAASPVQALFRRLRDDGLLTEAEAELMGKGLFTQRGVNELLEADEVQCTDENWPLVLFAYALHDGEVWRFDDDAGKKLIKTFSADRPQNRDFCLERLRQDFHAYLESERSLPPVSAVMTVQALKRAGGIGDLKYVQATTKLIDAVDTLCLQKKTVARTRTEIKSGLRAQETRFDEERWSEDDRAVFYSISSDVIAAAPSLYSSFLSLFEKMSPKQLRDFARTVFPLYQAQLVILEEPEKEEGIKAYKPKTLVAVRASVESLEENLTRGGEGDPLAAERERLILAVRSGFEQRFGLTKVPETLSDQHIRSIQNAIRYIANIHDRDAAKEHLISLYLGLSLNGTWQDFRQEKEISASDYFKAETAGPLQEVLKGRESLKTITAESLGITEKEVSEFQEILQDETISSMIGNVQTVDQKLGNIKRNIEDLLDPDLYENNYEKAMLALLGMHGKTVGTVLAKTYAECSGKTVSLSENERTVQGHIMQACNIAQFTPELVKGVQNSLQTPSLVLSVSNKLSEERVDEEIAELHKLLQPGEEIIAIFNKIGEEFKEESGALALSQDLSYLENIIVKNENHLTDDERTALRVYLLNIRSKMKQLETLLDRIKGYFEQLKKSSAAKSERIRERIVEIGKVVYAIDESVPVLTRVTSNFNLIIENIRQCLGCLKPEVNNDTNLTFGDSNRFFVMSTGEKDKGSIADEIVTFVPVEYSNGTKEMSFVFDQIYGSKSADMLLAHAAAVHKKFDALRKAFPQATISMVITEAALGSVGLDADRATARLQPLLKDRAFGKENALTITVPKSALGDTHTEFAGGARMAGPRKVERSLVIH